MALSTPGSSTDVIVESELTGVTVTGATFADGEADSETTPAVAAQLVKQDITFTAATAGLAGNDIKVALLAAGINQELTVDVADQVI